MSNQYPTHTERNRRRAQRFDARKATYNQPETNAQAQAEQNARYELRTLLIDAKDYHPNNPAKVVMWNTPDGGKGWSLNGGTSGRGKVILRVAVPSLENAYHLALAAKDAGYHIVNPDLLTA